LLLHGCRVGDQPALSLGGNRSTRHHRGVAAGPADFRPTRTETFVREESLPGMQVQSDDELLDYARRNGGTCYYASCTCMTGSHPMSFVDSELRAHGLQGLRIIDA
jgi:choline dehydrogenase